MRVFKVTYRSLHSRGRSPVPIAAEAVWAGLDILEMRKYRAMAEI